MAIDKPDLAESVRAAIASTGTVSRLPKKPREAAKATEPDVRLNANIAISLHMRLKMESVRTRRTIGEILEDLIRAHIPE